VTIDPRTPVLVGQAQVAQHEETIANARGPIELMAQAVSEAAVDAGIAKLGNASVIRVIRSLSTREQNPARSIARALGISANRYAYTPHGGNLPQTLVNTSALEIQRGDADLIILTGGEATRRVGGREMPNRTWRGCRHLRNPKVTTHRKSTAKN